MLIALGALAMVEMYDVLGIICPTSSGNVYTSEAVKILVFVIKFLSPGVSEPVTKFTLIVAVLPLILVAVNLSMMVAVTLLPTMYCVVCVSSTSLAGTRFRAVTVMLVPYTMTHAEPDGTVTTTPDATEIGPADIALLPDVTE